MLSYSDDRPKLHLLRRPFALMSRSQKLPKPNKNVPKNVPHGCIEVINLLYPQKNIKLNKETATFRPHESLQQALQSQYFVTLTSQNYKQTLVFEKSFNNITK